MKYTSETLIEVGREKVIQLFQNPDNMKYWQGGFISRKQVSGTPSQLGATAKINYKMGKRTVEMIETITHQDLPAELHGTYETQGVTNIQKNYFKDEGNTTRWISESEFQFSGFMKLMGLFMGAKPFKKQTNIYMDDFKAFAEGNPRHGT